MTTAPLSILRDTFGFAAFRGVQERVIDRVMKGGVREIIIAVNATVEGQTTAHYITSQLTGLDVKITRLAHGVPVGGELDYLDEGTLTAALRSRSAI